MNMRSIVEGIGRDLERMSCPVHGKKPTASVTGSTDKPQFTIDACCDEFLKKLQAEFKKRLDKGVTDAASKEINDMLKKTFK